MRSSDRGLLSPRLVLPDEADQGPHDDALPDLPEMPVAVDPLAHGPHGPVLTPDGVVVAP
eukprot:1609649-Pyramimonas_sp.AAC.1